MSGLDKNRFRDKTVSFRMSPKERRILEAKLKLTGKTKGEFIIDAILNNEINLIVGKYESDRLAVEIKRFREALNTLYENEEMEEVIEVLKDCTQLMEELIMLILKD